MCNAIGGGQKWIIDASTPLHRESVMSLLVLTFLVAFLAGAGIGAATGSWLIGCMITAVASAIAGVVLVLLTLFARAGIAGEIRRRWAPWLP